MLLAGRGSSRGALPSAVRAFVELHEDEVPVLEEALVLAARQVLGSAEIEPAVEVELRAGTAGPGWAGLPEVLRTRAQHDPLSRNTDGEPALDRLLVGPETELLVAFEHGHPDVGVDEPETLSRQLPRVVDGLALEVVAEREVAEHLEECEVASGVADVVDVDRPEDLLAARQPRRGWCLLAQEIGLQRVHAGDRQKSRGVVRGWHERGGCNAPVPALLEEAQIALADLIRGHHGRILGMRDRRLAF